MVKVQSHNVQTKVTTNNKMQGQYNTGGREEEEEREREEGRLREDHKQGTNNHGAGKWGYITGKAFLLTITKEISPIPGVR